MEKATGIKVLEYLMEEHDLNTSDFPDIASQEFVLFVLD